MHEVTAFLMDLPCPRHEVNTRQNSRFPTSSTPTSQSTFRFIQYHDTRRPRASRPRARARNHRVLADEWVFESILIRMGSDGPKGYLEEEWWSEAPSNRSAYIVSLGTWRLTYGVQYRLSGRNDQILFGRHRSESKSERASGFR